MRASLLSLDRRGRPDLDRGDRAGGRAKAVGHGLLILAEAPLAGGLLGRAPEAVHVAALVLPRSFVRVGLERFDLFQLALKHDGGDAIDKRAGVDVAGRRCDRPAPVQRDVGRASGPAFWNLLRAERPARLQGQRFDVERYGAL